MACVGTGRKERNSVRGATIIEGDKLAPWVSFSLSKGESIRLDGSILRHPIVMVLIIEN